MALDKGVDAVIASAFLGAFTTLLQTVPDKDEDTINAIEKAVDHLSRVIEGKEELDVDMLAKILEHVVAKLKAGGF